MLLSQKKKSALQKVAPGALTLLTGMESIRIIKPEHRCCGPELPGNRYKHLIMDHLSVFEIPQGQQEAL